MSETNFERLVSQEEYAEALIEWQATVRGWNVPTAVGAGLELGTKVATLMAFGYSDFYNCSNHAILRTSLEDETLFGELSNVSYDFRQSLLAEGYLVTCQDGDKITHLFHRGIPNTISFGFRGDDEDAIVHRLKQNTRIYLTTIKDGVYSHRGLKKF